MPNSRLTVEPSDLRQLVAHRESVQASDPLEAVHKHFSKHEYEFMLVLDGEHFVGLCERQKIGMVLGARFGFAMHSRQPVREAMLPEATIIKINQPLAEVLATTFSRPNSRLYDDVVLLDEADGVLGVIFSRTLVRLQNGLFLEKILQLESQQRELNKKNEQMEGEVSLVFEDPLEEREAAISGMRTRAARSSLSAACSTEAKMASASRWAMVRGGMTEDFAARVGQRLSSLTSWLDG